jgi:hypothetical protein
VLDDWKPSAGQSSFTPSQLSTTSQTPADERQTAVLFASAGQSTPTPSQFSVRSQSPALERQTTNAPCTLSAGQAPLEPVQFSARSHTPAEARQTVLLDRKTSTHVLAVPRQWSAASSSHAPPCEPPVHGVAAEANPSAGQSLPTPSQLSATSHWPAEDRQTAELFRSAGHPLLEPVQFSAGSHTPPEERHTVLLDLNMSTHVLAPPRQWSAGSSSHAPPCEAPVHGVAAEANTFAGQLPLLPVQFSATSH